MRNYSKQASEYLTVSHQSSKNCARAISFLAISASIASVTNVNNGFETSSLANFQMLDSLSNLNDDTSAFVTCTSSPECGHWWECPVIHHEVDIAHAESGRIELDQNIFRSRRRHRNFLNFLSGCQSFHHTGTADCRVEVSRRENQGPRLRLLLPCIALELGTTDLSE
jgi:hypothetical protein